MEVLPKKRNMNGRLLNKKKLFFVTILGIALSAVPILITFFDPLLMLTIWKIRLANGTLLHSLMTQELEGGRIYLSVFNITNAERFMSGEDDTVKVKEIGPFVYQEYRKNEELEIDLEPGIMRYTPSYRTEFILEESIGRPEDFELYLPNIALLASVQLLSKYPFFVGQLFRLVIAGMNLKALAKVNAHDYLWKMNDPLISKINSVVPGLVYFTSCGLMIRFFDSEAKYRLTLGTTDADKFQIKSVKRFQSDYHEKMLFATTWSYNNTYEGAAFPPDMTTDMPLRLYRYALCKPTNLKYTGSQYMEYGAEAFTYTFDNSSFNDRSLCDSKGWCPGGVYDMSPCYFGFPFAMTKGHFLDTEPKMFEKIEGLKPNRRIHETKVFIDPKISVTVGAYMSGMLSMALGDMSLLKETKRLSDIFLPVSHFVVKSPPMRPEVESALKVVYTYNPYITFMAQCICGLLGMTLLMYSARMYWHQKGSEDTPKTILSNQYSVQSQAPLIK